jgi:hypothetical protein
VEKMGEKSYGSFERGEKSEGRGERREEKRREERVRNPYLIWYE